MPCTAGGAPVAIDAVATRVIDGNTDRACRNQRLSAAKACRCGISSAVTMSGRNPSNTTTTTLEAACIFSPQGRIEPVTQPVAQHRNRERREHDGERWRQHDPGGSGDILATVSHHVAQTRHRRLNAEAEEREPAFEPNHLRAAPRS